MPVNPITGVEFSGDEYMLAQRDRRPHHHNYNGTTTYNDRHTHNFPGSTFTVNMLGRHSHRYNSVTTWNRGHRHRLTGWTSLSQGEYRRHTHTLSGNTSYNDRHQHRYATRSSQPIFERERGRR